MPVQCTCLQCGAVFSEKPSRVREGRAKFCSAPCANVAKTGPGKPCIQCGVMFKSQDRRVNRCSRRCRDDAKRTTLQERLHRGTIKGEGCWLRPVNLDKDGYSRVSKLTGNGFIRAHRLSYQLAYGEIPAGLLIRHRCHVRMCVRPDHLIVGTTAQNVADRVEAGRSAFGDRNGMRKQRS